MYKVAMFPNSSASRYWRLEDPGKYLRKLGYEVEIFTRPPDKAICEYFDIYTLEGIVDKEAIALMYEYQQEHGKKIVVDQDDDLVIDDSNPHKKDHEVSDAVAVVSKTLEIADLVTTTTTYLSHKLSRFNKNVRVFGNFMDFDRWILPIRQNKSNQIRIMWAGSITHLEDLKMIYPALVRIQREFGNKVKFIFMGDPRIKEFIPELNSEVMVGVPFEAYPTKLHSIAADIGIAPLVNNEFNRNKSAIKFLEYATSKYAGVYSETVYRSHSIDGNYGVVVNTNDQWYTAIKNYIVCPQLRFDIAEKAYAYVKAWYDLNDKIKNLDKYYQELFS